MRTSRNLPQQALLRMSGADLSLLRECSNMPESERLRFIGQGALVLVPAVLGAIAMTYAISTLVSNPLVYFSAGVLWCCIVAVVDWYVVATSHKSRLKGGFARWAGRAFALLVRFAFAIVVGVVVAHPLVMLCFDGTISQILDGDRRTALAARHTQALGEITALKPVASSTANLERLREEARRLQTCLTALQLDEQSGRAVAYRDCGSTSGSPSCGPLCQNIGTRIEEAKAEVASLDKRIAEAKLADATDRARYDAEVDKIRDRESVDVNNINSSFSFDYIARVGALEKLKERSPHVGSVELFLVLLFVFVDVLPLTMKLLTPFGEYELMRDTKLAAAAAMQRAEQEMIQSGRVQDATVNARAGADAVMAEVNGIMRVPLRILAERDETIREFEQAANRLRQASTDPAIGAMLEHEIANLRMLDQRASQAVLQRGTDFLRKV